MNPLIVDTNERGRLPDAIERRAKSRSPRVNLLRETLVNGDYRCGDWLIEAKSIGDLIQSKLNGHLDRQLDNMDANAGNYGLVIHGSIRDYVAEVKARGKDITYSHALKLVTGICGRVVADFGCLVYRSPDIGEAAAFMVALHEKTYKKASRHGAQAVRRVSTNDVRVDMLLTIPGIGAEMADAIIKSCGSIEEAVCGECLREVPRMGKTLRNRVMDVLTSEDEVRVEKTR
jgi:ERCC4-type nuclease